MGYLDTLWSVLTNPYVLAAISVVIVIAAFFLLPQNLFFALLALVLLCACAFLWIQLNKAIQARPAEEWLALVRRQLYTAAFKARFVKPVTVKMRRYRYNDALDRLESENPRTIGRCLGAGAVWISLDVACQVPDKENKLRLTPAFDLLAEDAKKPVYVLAMTRDDPREQFETIYFVPLENIDPSSLDDSGDIHEGNPILVYGALKMMEDGMFAVIDSMHSNQLDICKAALATTCSDAALIRSLNNMEMVSRGMSALKPEIKDKQAMENKEAGA